MVKNFLFITSTPSCILVMVRLFMQTWITLVFHLKTMCKKLSVLYSSNFRLEQVPKRISESDGKEICSSMVQFSDPRGCPLFKLTRKGNNFLAMKAGRIIVVHSILEQESDSITVSVNN